MLILIPTDTTAQQGATDKIEEQSLKTLDDWVARGGPTDQIQKTVVETCGKLVMQTASATEIVGFLGSQRQEFDFRVDVCAKMTINRVYKQPEFQKPELVKMTCESPIRLFPLLCKRSGLK